MPAPRGTMDFFAAQAQAKRHTLVLVVLFGLSIALTILLADLGVSLALSGTGRHVGPGVARVTGHGLQLALALKVRFGDLLLPVTGVVLFVVALGSASSAVRLGGDGGDAVARMLGGRPVDRLTQDPGERRAVNVLEEMALAAAIPVPRLYVLEAEPAINAFAAGTTPDRSVVAVTRGALEQLTRDELQGVFGHELSHLLNADARINLRLMALIGGLTVLALVGRVLLSAAGGGPGSRRRSGSGILVGIGLALLLAGAIGAFFGRLIRLAVSRQREFLADAEAIQFTRNPAGLSGALSKIAAQGSGLLTPHAPEAAHLFFADGVSGFFQGFLSTHPPIEERIRRLAAGGPAALLRPSGAPPLSPPSRPAPTDPRAIGLATAAAVGRPAPEHLEAAADALANFPPAITAAAREPFGARALSLALLLDRDPAVRGRQMAVVGTDPAMGAEVARLGAALGPVPREQTLALLGLALPSLDALSAEQARALVAELKALADADGRLTLHEWALQRLVRRRLAPQLGEQARAVRARSLEQVEVEALELLSALAWVGQRESEPAQRALDAGVQALGIAGRWRLLPRDRFSAARLDEVLSTLDEASPPLKARLLAGTAACVLADGVVTAAEADLLRAIAGSLGLPMPALPAAAGPSTASAA